MIPIILCTHGELSKQILSTVEILLGKQENIECISFLENDTIESLNKYYLNTLNKLIIKDGIICAVDIWGGSAFNLACQNLKNTNYDYYIISGINIPMLIDFFILRKDYRNNIKDISNSMIKSGKLGINLISKINLIK